MVVVVVYMQCDANVVSPKILGDSIGLGSFWILFSIILFGGLFGVWGMLIAVPVFAMIYRWCTRFTNRHLKKKGLPVEAFAYNSPGEDVTVPDEVVDAGKDEKNGGEQ